MTHFGLTPAHSTCIFFLFSHSLSHSPDSLLLLLISTVASFHPLDSSTSTLSPSLLATHWQLQQQQQLTQLPMHSAVGTGLTLDMMASNANTQQPVMSTSTCLSGNNNTTIEEISTIFVVGFPDDMHEREFQNMFIFSPGFEAATLKSPSKEQEDDNGRKQTV